MKIRAEISNTDKDIACKINKMKSWLFEKSKNKPYTRTRKQIYDQMEESMKKKRIQVTQQEFEGLLEITMKNLIPRNWKS